MNSLDSLESQVDEFGTETSSRMSINPQQQEQLRREFVDALSGSFVETKKPKTILKKEKRKFAGLRYLQKKGEIQAGSRRQRVGFKEQPIEVFEVENWKMYNKDEYVQCKCSIF